MVKAKSFGVDIASYQNGNSRVYTRAGAKFVVVKTTQYNYAYMNPKAASQIRTARQAGALPMGYFYATFSASATRAKAEANYACLKALRAGLPKGSYFAVDWEVGSGNVCNSRYLVSNTGAVNEALRVIKAYGFKPLLYSGAYVMRSCLNISSIVKKWGSILWVASYATMGRIDVPNFHNFPSMNGVLIWQFTDNWKGMNVDGNICVLDLNGSKKQAKKPSPTPKVKAKPKPKAVAPLKLHPVCPWNMKRVFVVARPDGAALYKDTGLHHKIGSRKYNSAWQVFGEKDGAICVGKNMYFDGRAGFTKSNPIATNDHKHGLVKNIMGLTHALKQPKPDGQIAYRLKPYAQYEIVGRSGRFLRLKTKDGSKRYVSGKHCYVVL